MSRQSSELDLRALLLWALGVFFCLQLGFLFESYPRTHLGGVRLVEYWLCWPLIAVAMGLTARGRCLAACLVLAVIDVLCLHIVAVTVLRWALCGIMLLSLYLTLEARRARRGRANDALLYVLVMVLAVHLLGALGELGLRALTLTDDPRHMPFLSFGNTHWKTAQMYDAETNSLGMRERELPAFEPPGTYRVLLDGDSVTFGVGVPIDQTLGRQLEVRLNYGLGPQTGLHYETINMGVPAYNTADEFRSLDRHGAYYEPDLVMVVWYPNDIEGLGNDGYHCSQSSYLDAIYESSLLYTYLSAQLCDAEQALGLHEKYIDYLHRHFAAPDEYQQMQQYFLNMQIWCRHTHRKLMVVLYPFVEQLSAYPLAAEHDKVKQSLDKMGVACLDLLPTFRNQEAAPLQVSPAFDHHPNGRADAMAAQAIYTFIVGNGLGRR